AAPGAAPLPRPPGLSASWSGAALKTSGSPAAPRNAQKLSRDPKRRSGRVFDCRSRLGLPYHDRHNGCFSDSHAPFCFELATAWVIKFMPSTPSAMFGYRLLLLSTFWLLARAIMSS